jgi:hypothetical protein
MLATILAVPEVHVDVTTDPVWAIVAALVAPFLAGFIGIILGQRYENQRLTRELSAHARIGTSARLRSHYATLIDCTVNCTLAVKRRVDEPESYSDSDTVKAVDTFLETMVGLLPHLVLEPSTIEVRDLLNSYRGKVDSFLDHMNDGEPLGDATQEVSDASSTLLQAIRRHIKDLEIPIS